MRSNAVYICIDVNGPYSGVFLSTGHSTSNGTTPNRKQPPDE